jgi:tetratricopeptide (TPR) repeat protein
MPDVFVSRKDELKLLQHEFELVCQQSQPRFVLVNGDVGTGKSYLVKHFISLLNSPRQTQPVFIGQGICSMETQENGLSPFIQILTSLKTSTEAVLGSLMEFTRRVAPAWADFFSGGLYAAATLTAREAMKALAQPVFSQENIFGQYATMYLRVAEKHPLVIFLDDLQWADATSLQLLFYLARNLMGGRILFVLAFRPLSGSDDNRIFREVLANLVRQGAQTIELDRGLDVWEYVRRRYPLNDFQPPVIQKIAAITEGHALFVSQLFALGEQRGLISPQPGSDGLIRWHFEGDAALLLTLPQTLSKVLEERLHLMDTGLRNILNIASVEGVQFTAQVVMHVLQIEQFQLYDRLRSLRAEHHLVIDKEDDPVAAFIDQYTFVHRYVREFVYAELEPGERRERHHQVAESLVALYGESNLLKIASQLAEHYDAACEYRQAAEFALLAARTEQMHYAWAEAEKWCHFGLDQVKNHLSMADAGRLYFDFLILLGSGFYQSGNFPAALQRYQEALMVAEQVPIDTAARIEIHQKLADASLSEANYPAALAWIEKGLTLIPDIDAGTGLLRFKLDVIRARVYSHIGEDQQTVNFIRQLLTNQAQLDSPDPAERAEIEDQKVLAYNVLGCSHSNLGQYTAAVTAFQNGIDLAQRVKHHPLLAMLLLNLTFTYMLMQDDTQAFQANEQGRAAALQTHDSESIALAQCNDGFLLSRRGDYAGAVRALKSGIAGFAMTGSEWDLPYAYADLAVAWLGQGNRDEALSAADKGLTLARTSGVPYGAGYALTARARVLQALGRSEDALSDLEEAIAVHRKAGHNHLIARTLIFMGTVLKTQGKNNQAQSVRNEARQILHRLNLEAEDTGLE